MWEFSGYSNEIDWKVAVLIVTARSIFLLDIFPPFFFQRNFMKIGTFLRESTPLHTIRKIASDNTFHPNPLPFTSSNFILLKFTLYAFPSAHHIHSIHPFGYGHPTPFDAQSVEKLMFTTFIISKKY